MRIAITDNSQYDRSMLMKYLLNFCGNNNIDAELFEYESGEALMKNFKTSFFDAVFLDICMKGINGIDTAREIHNRDKSCRIIFLTAVNNFAAESYEIGALYYMIKPATQKKIDEVMVRCLKTIIDREKRLYVTFNNTPIKIPFSKILYVDVNSRRVKFHFANQTIETYRGFYTLVNPLLEDSRFIEPFKGVVVNMEHIVRNQKNDFLLDNGDTVPISKRKKRDIVQAYTEYAFNRI